MPVAGGRVGRDAAVDAGRSLCTPQRAERDVRYISTGSIRQAELRSGDPPELQPAGRPERGPRLRSARQNGKRRPDSVASISPGAGGERGGSDGRHAMRHIQSVRPKTPISSEVEQTSL